VSTKPLRRRNDSRPSAASRINAVSIGNR
jgi:hypothetical protein